MAQKLHLKKDRFLIYFFVFLGVLILSLIGCLLFLKHILTLQIQSDRDRFESFLLADELRQSSDDLTNMVRLYVITGEPRYRNYFYEILAIRSGELPRPKNYNQIYWDLVEEGVDRPRPHEEKKALKARMLDHGFTIKEFDLLQKSENMSNDLAGLEKEAIHAMEGRFNDGTGNYTIRKDPDPELAKRIVFGEKYRTLKREIMTPLQEFFEDVEARTALRSHRLHREVVLVITIAIILAAFSFVMMLLSIIKALRSLHQATSDSETLLLNVLPLPIADRLKEGEEPITDEIPQASVIFIDIVGFTKATIEYGGTKMVEILNLLFDEFDTLSEQFGVEKVKTIGDNYMAVAGVTISAADHAIRVADFALAILEKMQAFNETHQLHLEVRIGMTYGAVVAGVIGHKKFIYDVWGDVVNTASRMESTGESGKIQMTEKMAMMLSEQYEVEEHRELELKGIGKVKTFFLKGKKGAKP